MILNPAIVALVGGSLLITAYAVYAAFTGIQITAYWNLASGSEYQLTLERRTYLISTILSYLMAFQVFSLFLFIYTADHIHPLFVGAMCAAGALNVNDYGYPTLVTKLISLTLCGLWLIVNHADNRAPDYPLIRFKYKLLLLITVVLVFESFLQINYFGRMKTHVITSCCGTLFSEDARSVAGAMASLPPAATQAVFFVGAVLVVRSGLHFILTNRRARMFALLSGGFMAVSLAAVVAFISVYYYQLPTHHCPFDLLQKEYHFIGYPLYASLFTAGIAGGGVGVVDRFKTLPTLVEVVPDLQKKMSFISLSGNLLFLGMVLYPILFNDFKLLGY